jgi:hypothetical protein
VNNWQLNCYKLYENGHNLHIFENSLLKIHPIKKVFGIKLVALAKTFILSPLAAFYVIW